MFSYALTSASPVSGCTECDAVYSHETLQCSHDDCRKVFCSEHAWRCNGCAAVLCGEHIDVVGCEAFCASCGTTQREHNREIFELIRLHCERQTNCPECNVGKIENRCDPFGDLDQEEVYGCARCGLEVAKRRKPSEALRTAQALRYCGGPALPPADYVVTDGQRLQGAAARASATDARLRGAA